MTLIIRVLKRAHKLLKAGYLSRADRLFRMAVAFDESSAQAWRGLAATREARKDTAGAQAAYRRALHLSPYDIKVLRGLGRVLLRAGFQDEGQSYLLQAYALAPTQAATRKLLVKTGVTHHAMLDAVLSRSVPSPVNSKGKIPAFTAFMVYRRALRAERRQQPIHAAKLYKKLLRAFSDKPDLLLDIGDALARTAGFGVAEKAYLQACAKAPDHLRVRRRLADSKLGFASFSLGAQIDLQTGRNGVSTTISSHARILLDPDGRHWPTGWTEIVVKVEDIDSDFQPMLCVWSTQHDENVFKYTLPAFLKPGTLRVMLRLPSTVQAMAFEPSGQAGTKFRLINIGWVEKPDLHSKFFSIFPRHVAWQGQSGEPEGAEDCFDRTAHAFKIAPHAQLARNSDGTLTTTGCQARLNLVPLREGFPKGLTVIEFNFDDFSASLKPRLYIRAEGVTQVLALPVIDNTGKARIVLQLPLNTTSLSLAPTAVVGLRFRVAQVRYLDADHLSDYLFEPTHTPYFSPWWRLVPDDGVQVDAAGAYHALAPEMRFGIQAETGWDRLPNGVAALTLAVKRTNAALDAVLYILTSNSQDIACYFPPLMSGSPVRVHTVLPPDAYEIRLVIKNSKDLCFSGLDFSICDKPIQEGDVYRLNSGKVGGDSFRPLLTPVADLVPGLAGQWVVTGHDPQFAVAFEGRPLPTGWSLLQLSLDCGNNIVNPILFVWSNGKVLSYSLPLMTGATRQSVLLALPEHVDALRFDPTDHPDVTFKLDEFSFHPPSSAPGGVWSIVKSHDLTEEYKIWVQHYDTLTSVDRDLIHHRIAQMSRHPLISVVMPVYNTEPRFLRRALDTVVEQLYPYWELCISDDASPRPEIREILEDYAARDSRIKVIFRAINGHISQSSNSALTLVTGEFVALMDHDDELPAHALYMVAEEVLAYPDVDIIYTDEDKIDSLGQRHDPHFKTDWNEDLFLSQNMVAHLGVYRTSLVRAVGGFRAGFEGSQDYDFTLRALNHTSPELIRHIPFVLYHWRIFEGVRSFSSNNPSTSVDTARQAMVEWMNTHLPGTELLSIKDCSSWWRIRRPIPDPAPSVTLIVPTRDRVHLIRNLLDGILNRTDYPNFDVIIVDNGSVEEETRNFFFELSRDARVQILRDEGAFNYSRLNNVAVQAAKGTYVAFLNNDIEIIDADWLDEMMSQAIRPDVGAVGTKLLYGHGTIQHAGVVLGVYGVAAHSHRHFEADAIGYFGHPQLIRQTSAVTAAALVMRKSLFEQIGGFDEENLAVSYNDVDLCLRVHDSGYKVVYTPFATLRHLESASRGADITPHQRELQRVERGFMQLRWAHRLENDPFYSPNLSLDNEDYRLAFPPRTVKPWLDQSSPADFLAQAGQSRLDAQAIDAQNVAMIAATTVLVIAGGSPWSILSTLVDTMRPGDLWPGRIIAVDNTPVRDRFIGRAVMKRLRASFPDLDITIMRDDHINPNLSRGVNLGIAQAADASYLAIVTENGRLARGWLKGVILAYLTQGSGAIIAGRTVLPDGHVELPADWTKALPAPLPTLDEGWTDLPVCGAETVEEALRRPVTEEVLAPAGDLLFMRRDILSVLPAPGQAPQGTLFDPWLQTQARYQDLALRLRDINVPVVTTYAAALTLSQARAHDLTSHWRVLSDLMRLNRRAQGLADDQRLEFVCPFHRGDMLLGLQVANTAWAEGMPIRMHVAEGLMSWVRAFSPPFPVEAIPVPVPSAERTALELLHSLDHVLHREDVSTSIARSHPDRGLDEMQTNLVAEMLRAVGLAGTTLLAPLAPLSTPSDEAKAKGLLASWGPKVVLVHRSGGWALKTIPDHVLDQLVKLVHGQGCKLVQIGGPGDQRALQCDGWIMDGFDPGLWAAIFRQSKALIGVDSWSSHMAAILDVPQITLYGSTHPMHVASRPAFPNRKSPALLIAPSVDCSPCNSLSCLRASLSYCMGYQIDEDTALKIQDFLRDR